MVNVLVETPDLDVFGGPTSIEVSTDFGKPGIRGPIFWVGDRSPEDFFLPSQKAQVRINDFFISTNSEPEFYSWLYKRVPAVGVEGARWETVLRLSPQQYSFKHIVVFNDGAGTLRIDLDQITKDNPLTTNFVNKFIIRSSFENDSDLPVASSFTYSIEQNTKLKIDFNAIAFDGSDWVGLQETHKIHIFVSYLV
jgi:hypothetical protein